MTMMMKVSSPPAVVVETARTTSPSCYCYRTVGSAGHRYLVALFFFLLLLLLKTTTHAFDIISSTNRSSLRTLQVLVPQHGISSSSSSNNYFHRNHHQHYHSPLGLTHHHHHHVLFNPTRGGAVGGGAFEAQHGTSLSLAASATSDADASASSSSGSSGIDFSAILKYGLALIVQMSLIYGLLSGIDKFVVPLVGNKPLPAFINIPMFYLLALKSRIFNPLSNQRPLPSTKEIPEDEQQRIMPSWTPPGFIFPIVWLLIIGPLRAVTSNMIVQSTGQYASKAIMALMLHLSIGDIWNTINNVERRYGTSVLGVVCVYVSAAFACKQYYDVLPIAGRLLSIKLIWLTIASTLIFKTWRLNKNPKTDKPYNLLPMKGEGSTTKLIWFGLLNNSSDD